MKLGARVSAENAKRFAIGRRPRSGLAFQAGATLAAGSLVLTACGTDPDAGGEGDNGTEAAGEDITLRLGHTNEAQHPNEVCGADNVIEQVSEETGGTLTIETYPASQLGSNNEMGELVARGDLDMQIMPVPVLAQYYPPVGVLNTVYLFDSVEESNSVVNGEIGDQLWADALEESDIRVLGSWYYGARQLTTSDTPVRTPEDLEGLNIRAIDNEIQIANITALGAEPTPIAFAELYLALQQGVVNGQENPIATIATSKFDEVQDYIMLTDHLFPWLPVVISESSWQSLSSDQQEALEQAVRDAAPEVQECIESEEEEYLSQWREGGAMEVIDDVDRDAFKARAREFFPGEFEDTWGDLYSQITEATSE